MGKKHFGNLATIRGIIYYRLSPHEQKPFAGAIKYGLPNFFPRATATVATWLPPMLLSWLIYTSVEKAYWNKGRKNPKDYIDEVDPNPVVPEVEKTKKKC